MQVLYLLSYVGSRSVSSFSGRVPLAPDLERETGLEPATLSLEG
jgi:hypothetical protein